MIANTDVKGDIRLMSRNLIHLFPLPALDLSRMRIHFPRLTYARGVQGLNIDSVLHQRCLYNELHKRRSWSL